MQQDLKVIDWIFAKMLIRYGSLWSSKWEAIPEAAVKADWAEQLANMPRESILYAIGFLPLEFPPTVTQFREICKRAPDRTPKPRAISAPPADPAKVAALVAKARAMQAARKPRQWAHELQAREEAGEKLNERQREAWRGAVRTESVALPAGWFTPIDPNCLPPGMRSTAQRQQLETKVPA